MRSEQNPLKEIIKDIYIRFYTPLFILFSVMILAVLGYGMWHMLEKKVASEETINQKETIDRKVPATKISIKNIKWDGATRVIDCDFEPIDGAKKYYAEVCSDEDFIFGCIKVEINTSSPLRVHIEQNKWNAAAPDYVRVRAKLSENKYTDWSKVMTIKADEKLAKLAEKDKTRRYWMRELSDTMAMSLVVAGTILFTIKTIKKGRILERKNL